MPKRSIILTGAPIEETIKNQDAVNKILKHILSGYLVEEILVQARIQRIPGPLGGLNIVPAYGIPKMIWIELRNMHPNRTKELITPKDLRNTKFMQHQNPVKHYDIITKTMMTNIEVAALAEQAVEKLSTCPQGQPSVKWTIT